MGGWIRSGKVTLGQKSTERAAADNPACLPLITRLLERGADVRMH